MSESYVCITVLYYMSVSFVCVSVTGFVCFYPEMRHCDISKEMSSLYFGLAHGRRITWNAHKRKIFQIAARDLHAVIQFCQVPSMVWTHSQCQHSTAEHFTNRGIRSWAYSQLKGTVSRDFSSPVFFIKQFLLVPMGMPSSDFEFFRIFVELFVFVLDSPVVNTPSSRLRIQITS
jgi:hypothetical protein